MMPHRLDRGSHCVDLSPLATWCAGLLELRGTCRALMVAMNQHVIGYYWPLQCPCVHHGFQASDTHPSE